MEKKRLDSSQNTWGLNSIFPVIDFFTLKKSFDFSDSWIFQPQNGDNNKCWIPCLGGTT